MKKETHQIVVSRSAPRALSPLLSTAIALCASAAGGCMVSIEAEAPDIEVTQKDVVFPGSSGGATAGNLSMTHSFSQKHQKLDLPQGLTPEVKALEVTLTAKSGITSFDFIHYLRLSMSDDADNTNAIEAINYERDTTGTTGPVLTMPSANPVNALEQWKTDSAVFTVDVAGQLPESDWTADVTVRFAGKVSYRR